MIYPKDADLSRSRALEGDFRPSTRKNEDGPVRAVSGEASHLPELWSQEELDARSSRLPPGSGIIIALVASSVFWVFVGVALCLTL